MLPWDQRNAFPRTACLRMVVKLACVVTFVVWKKNVAMWKCNFDRRLVYEISLAHYLCQVCLDYLSCSGPLCNRQIKSKPWSVCKAALSHKTEVPLQSPMSEQTSSPRLGPVDHLFKKAMSMDVLSVAVCVHSQFAIHFFPKECLSSVHDKRRPASSRKST